ncbi:MAG: hypothetical protein WKF84_22120 [Pyrinomonadaceae bacterium]
MAGWLCGVSPPSMVCLWKCRLVVCCLSAERADVERISPDHLAQQTASHLEAATGTDQVRSWNFLGTGFTGLDGSGVGVAILDSGMMASHRHFADALGLSRVAAAADTVSSNSHLANFCRLARPASSSAAHQQS